MTLSIGQVWNSVGSAVASWLVCSTPERAVWVWALAGDIVLCSWARHFTLTVPLSTQVYKWVPVNLMLVGNPAMDLHSIQEGVKIFLVTSCYRNWDKLRPDGPQLACMQTLPYLGLEPSTSHTTVWCTTNWANQVVVNLTDINSRLLNTLTGTSTNVLHIGTSPQWTTTTFLMTVTFGVTWKTVQAFKDQIIPACPVSKASFQDMEYHHKSKTREKETVIIGLDVNLFT